MPGIQYTLKPRLDRPTRNGRFPLVFYARVQGKQIRHTIEITVLPDFYDPANMIILKGDPRLAIENGKLTSFKHRLDDYISTIWRKNGFVTVREIQQHFKPSNSLLTTFLKFTEYNLNQQKSGLSAETWREQTSKLDMLKDYIGENSDIEIQEMNDQWFLTYKAHLEKGQNNANTIAKKFQFIKKFRNLAIRQGLVKPGTNIVKTPYSAPPPKFWSLEEVLHFDKHVDMHHQIGSTSWIVGKYFLLSCHAGFRYGDLLDFDLIVKSKMECYTSLLKRKVNLYTCLFQLSW